MPRESLWRAIGVGLMSVLMDTGMKPYGQVARLSGEIAEDLTYYCMTSFVVTPSSVGLESTVK